MKRHKHLYDQVCAFENLLQAARQAQRGKRFTPAVAAFNHNLEYELLRLQDELQTRTYMPGAYRTFTINDPKTRLICAAPYRDRIVHHALCNVIEPIFDRTFIYDSYACRTGKGTHAAVDRLSRFQQSSDYVLKCDIQKYFASIDHAILKTLLRHKIGCIHTLWLTDTIIDHSNPQEDIQNYFPGDNLFSPAKRRHGLPLGNQTSQFFANLYLDPLDHFIKETLRCRRYVRYVDDFVILEDEKALLWETRDCIAEFLAKHLRLCLHPKKQQVTPVSCGVDFLGYFVYPTHRLLRRTSGFRFARNLKQMQRQYRAGVIAPKAIKQRVAAWLGHARHADTNGLKTALLANAVFSRA